MRTDLSDEQVARSGRVGWGAVSQARDGEDGLRVDRRDSLGEDDEDGISLLLFIWQRCWEEIILRRHCGQSASCWVSQVHPPARALGDHLKSVPGRQTPGRL